MEYDWNKIIAELSEGSGPFLTYPGDDGSEDEHTRIMKASSYADWVETSAWVRGKGSGSMG